MVHDVTPRATMQIMSLLRMLRPHRVVGASKVRLGKVFDGGYVMLDRFDDVAAAYSLGINDDVSWDLDIARRGIALFQYDHTIERLPVEHRLFHWQKTGIADVPSDVPPMDTLENLLAANGHATRDDLILKCDIETYEWRVFASMPHSVVRQFRQIVIELHSLGTLAHSGPAEVARAALDNLTASHRVVHVHANNFAEWSVVGGVPVPDVIELTLARLDQGVFEPSDEVFPTALDMPCNCDRADLFLGRFVFE